MEYTVEQIRAAVKKAAAAVIAAKDMLTELDSHAGDGDMGISMEKGALALGQEAGAYAQADIGGFFLKCAMSFNRAAPSTLGTLFSGALMALGKEFRGKTAIGGEAVAKIPGMMAESVMARGKAAPGDKTVLDALVPLARAMESTYAQTAQLSTALAAAASAARQGAEATRGMLARTGRAKWIAQRSREFPDAGASLCALVMEALAK